MNSAAVMAVFEAVSARAHVDAAAPRTVAMTSAIRREGTSSIAVGTALSLAAFDAASKVLLVDANWIHPSLTEQAGLSVARGLAECLRDGYALERAIVPTARRGLSFLPAGQSGDEAPPLGGLAALLANARHDFVKIVIDLPPVMVAPSLVVPWADVADQTYLVVRRGATPVNVIRKAMTEIGKERPLLILNRSRERSDFWTRAG